MNSNPQPAFFQSFTLNDALYLGFCATFIVITKAVLRLHLRIPGHSMFFMMFFLILARACVPKLGSSTLVGFVAGVVSTLLGMGKGGPLMIMKFVFPAIIVDVGVSLYPLAPFSLTACLLLGAIASSTRFITFSFIEWLIGMDKTIILQRAAISSVMSMFFGAAGSAMVPPIVRRLKIHGLIP